MSTGIFPLEALQMAAAEIISGDVMFNGSQSDGGVGAIPVLYEIKGDVQNLMDIALGSIGFCVTVLTPTFRLHDATVVPTSLDGFAHLVVSVFESRTMNPSGVHALSAAQNILGLLHGTAHGVFVGAGEPGTFKSDPNQDAIVLTNDAPALQYSVPFVARVQIVRPSPY